jgi:hypothetical protein
VSARQLIERIIALRPDLADRARALLNLLDSVVGFSADDYAEDVEHDPEGVLRHLESMLQVGVGEAIQPMPPAEYEEIDVAEYGRATRRIESYDMESYEMRRLPLTRRIIDRLRGILPTRQPTATGAGPLPPERPAAYVSTGFADADAGRDADGDQARPVERTLAARRDYRFWLEIAPAPLPFSIETSPQEPLPILDAGTVLHVVLFGFEDGLQTTPGQDVGALRLVGDGRAVVHQGGPGERRLSFPVRTPGPGLRRMRVNIYCKQTLLQSRVVTVQVTEEEMTVGGPAATSDLDFAAHDLDARALEPIKPRALSILINDNGNGTHGFRFFGQDEKARDVTLAADVVGELLDAARQGLRMASWGTEAESPPDTKTSYKYATPRDEVMARDLVDLAKRGYELWDVVAEHLAADAEALQELMRAPGRVELANKAGVQLMVPAACIYDFPLDMAKQDSFTICPDFIATRPLGLAALLASPCFQGNCPSRVTETVVCPAGFWGFRHQIGLVPSRTTDEDGTSATQPLEIPGRPPVFVVGASADPNLEKLPTHMTELHGILAGAWQEQLSRTKLFTQFQTKPSVVYLYGHGGEAGGKPFFEVGQAGDGPIERSMLRANARWADSTPLVFLNGCHTAALGPRTAFAYAGAFMSTAKASAVVGTEIAVFEALAVRFAEECLRRFVVDGADLGESVRLARLALLAEGNPLGLVYVAFGPSELHLAQTA